MEIINHSKIFTNKQIKKFIQFLGEDYTPKKLYLYESRIWSLKFIWNPIDFFQILSGKIEGLYFPYFDSVHVFIFSEKDDGDNKQSKQLYSLHALCHEVRHKYQNEHNITKDKEADADRFATNKMNNNACKVKEIMGWKREWKVYEED